MNFENQMVRIFLFMNLLSQLENALAVLLQLLLFCRKVVY
jgi:hypothetical protein